MQRRGKTEAKVQMRGEQRHRYTGGAHSRGPDADAGMQSPRIAEAQVQMRGIDQAQGGMIWDTSDTGAQDGDSRGPGTD